MRCEICKRDPNLIIILPKWQPDGGYITIACEECSIASGLYCTKHKMPHLGFDDGTTICTDCTEQEVLKSGERVAGLFAHSIVQSPHKEFIQGCVYEYLESINSPREIGLADLRLFELIRSTPQALNIARPIIVYAKRKHTTPEEVIKKVAETGKVIFL